MAVLHINFMSAALGRQVNFTAVIPSVDFDHLNIEEVYNPKRKLKVLWLLHGFSGDENDYLTDVMETYEIKKTEDGAESQGNKINVNSHVSMNMWGLTPEFVGLLEEGFVEFFENIKGDEAKELKGEYLLPIYIDELLKKGKVSVKLLETQDKWFGVTYKEDKPVVVESFAKLIADGVYRKDLFSDLQA